MSTTSTTFGIKRMISHGQILRSPALQPEGTTGNVTYELGYCLQLDQSHCLLLASLDEQGGGDLCVGNDGFVFEHISDIKPDRAIPLNRVDPDYPMKNGRGKAFLAKFPAGGGFVPLDGKLPDGRTHPAAGTGFLVSTCVSFAQDKTSALTEPESMLELMQIRWDGQTLSVSPGVLVTQLLGLELSGDSAVSTCCNRGESLLLPLGVAGQICVFQFDWNGRQWIATDHGEPFTTNPCCASLPGEPYKIGPGEMEPSLKKQDGRYLLYTRGTDPVGRLYESADGLNYRWILNKPNHTVPQVLNQGLDGSLYVATNPGPGMLRNPLLAYPLHGDRWGEPLTIHDQDGIRDDHGTTIPFVDHGIAANVVLEGRWRHLIFYRVCDLKERTLHPFQIDAGQDLEIHGKSGPLSRKLPTSGLYLAEFEYEQGTNLP